MSAKSRWAVLGLCVLLGVGVYWATRQNAPQGVLQVRAPQASKPASATPDPPALNPAPLLDAASDQPATTADDRLQKDQKDPSDYGLLPPVPADLNPQVRAVAEALRTKSHPERTSTIVRPAAFNAAAYQADPEVYLNTPEPARVYQPAQPGPGVPRLASLTPYYQEIVQGNSVVLRASAPPGAPVTFTTLDAGEFSNRLTTISVRADERGTAEAQFTGTPGTIENINILAASPMAAGQLKYVVRVTLPEAGR